MASPTTQQVISDQLTEQFTDTLLAGIKTIAWEGLKFFWGWPGLLVLAVVVLVIARSAWPVVFPAGVSAGALRQARGGRRRRR